MHDGGASLDARDRFSREAAVGVLYRRRPIVGRQTSNPTVTANTTVPMAYDHSFAAAATALALPATPVKSVASTGHVQLTHESRPSTPEIADPAASSTVA